MSKIWSSVLMYLFLVTVIDFHWVNSIQFNQQLCSVCKALGEARWGLQRTHLQGANILVPLQKQFQKFKAFSCSDKGFTQRPLLNTGSRKQLFPL